MAQKQWYHFGIGAPPIFVYFGGDWDVHRGGVLTHGHLGKDQLPTGLRKTKTPHFAGLEMPGTGVVVVFGPPPHRQQGEPAQRVAK